MRPEPVAPLAQSAAAAALTADTVLRLRRRLRCALRDAADGRVDAARRAALALLPRRGPRGAGGAARGRRAQGRRPARAWTRRTGSTLARRLVTEAIATVPDAGAAVATARAGQRPAMSRPPVSGVTARPAPPGRALDDSRCSVQALARGDSPVATASPAQRWLLIEQPGPWGRDALTESRFDAEVAPLLARRSRAENVRLLLVRRPGDRLADSGRRWAYADSRPGREGLWWSTRAADADLLTAPWDGSVGEPARRPDLPGLHARRPRRLLRAARPAARPGAAGARAGRRLGVQPPRRRPVRRQRARAAARLLLRAGARRRRRAGRRARARARWRCPGCAAGPACRSRRRPPSTRPAGSWACSALDDLPVVAVAAADRRRARRSSGGW